MASNNSHHKSTVSMDDPLVILGIVGGLYIAMWAAWYFGHAHIAKGYAYLRYAQFYLFHALGETAPLPGVSDLHAWVGTLCAPSGMAGACQRDFATVSWGEIADSSFLVNIVSALVVLGFCVWQFVRVNRSHPKLRFARKHSVKSFLAELKGAVHPASGQLLYPHLRMFSALNLVDEPLSDPVFGMSLSSKQFIFVHGLVADWRDEGGGAWSPALDRQKATEVFRAQLGARWTSSSSLTVAETLLAAIAMPRVAATDTALPDEAFRAAMAVSEEMLRFCWDQFRPPAAAGRRSDGDALAWLSPDIDLTRAREVIRQYIRHKPVQAIIEKHAFNRTVLFGLFMQARRLGVLPPAEMRWLRFYDRGLWYVLETIGRQAGFAEAAGVLSHFLYEAKAGRSIVEPQVDKAVSGLETAINNFKFPQEERARYAAERRDSHCSDGARA